jgi:hypothetical protein
MLRNLIYVVIFLTVFVSNASAQNSAQPSAKCAEVAKEIEYRKEHLLTILSSLQSLLEGGVTSDVPLSVLFQVDFTDTAQVEQRKKELVAYDKPEAIKKLPEFSDWWKCAESLSLEQSIEEVAKTLATVNARKIAFFNLEQEKRQSILRSYEAARNKGEADTEMKNELKKSRKSLVRAQQDLIQSEVQSAQDRTEMSENIVVARSSVEKFLVDIESEFIEFIDGLNVKKEKLNDLQKKITELAIDQKQPAKEQLSLHFREINAVWEESVDQIFQLFSNVDITSNYQIPEPLVYTGITGEEDQKLYNEYAVKYKNARERAMELSRRKTVLLNQLKAQNFRILSDSGSLRATLLSKCDETPGCDRPQGLTNANLRNITREIKVLPLRYMAGGLSKWLEVKAKFASGFEGWVDIFRQLLILLVLILIPFGLVKLLNWSSATIDRFRKDLLAHSMLNYRKRTNMAVWIARLNPFVPSVGMILSVMIARSLLETTDLKELSGILFYLQVYFVYKAFRLLLKITLEIVFSTDSVDKLKDQKIRIEESAKRISRLIFIEYASLHFIEDTVRRALIYGVISDFIFWLNIFFVFYEAKKWDSEIKNSFYYRFPKYSLRLKKISHRRFGFLLNPFVFIAIAAHDFWQFVSAHLLRLDFVKRFLSEVLRRRLSTVDDQPKKKPSNEYLEYFDYYLPAKKEFFIDRESSIAHPIEETLAKWIPGDTSDDLIVIVGDRGMGKTTTLNRIFDDLEDPEDFRKIFHRVAPKILNEEALFLWLSELIESPVQSVADFKKWDTDQEKKLVLFVDDIQNLFMGTIGGFNAYRKFIEIISLKTRNVFWCLTVNSRSWSYLKGVFGEEHFYGPTMNLKPWRDFEIQKLIMARHKMTNYKRTFDESIRAYGAGESVGQQAETQFFRLLWGQSRGNPRSALMYWVSAISSPTKEHVHVGVPSFISSSVVSSMSDEALFILASIARHDSLNHEELRLTTGIEDSIIRKCLKEANDKDLVWTDEEQRVRISSRAQYVIDYFLVGKNFLYE